jgi:FtsP/CotA-like multicopper oxidase with cupredoxin domain
LERFDRGPGRLEAMRTASAVSRGGLNEPLANPPEIRSADDLLEHTLAVDYGENEIYNIKEGKNLKVKLRSYNGGLFGKTLRIEPGDQLKILVDNRLPEDRHHAGDINVPHRFNTTNLHTHGLHVSPSGNSDNVLIAIPPKASFQNEISVSREHTSGTFWYHSHVHGSTAIQVTSGMAGALIIEGGLDRAPGIQGAQERIMLFQQIPYVESEVAGVYVIEDYRQFTPTAWDAGVNEKGWRTTINGQTQPIVIMQPGEVQRWRMVHAGLRETIDVGIVPYERATELMGRESARLAQEGDGADRELRREAVQARRRALAQESIKLNEVAADGLAYGFAWPRESIELQPGYRSDALVKIDTPGLYVLVDNEVSEENSLWRRYESPRVLGFVLVAGPPKPMPLPTNEQLAQYRPHRPIGDDEVTEPAIPPGTSRPKRLQKVEFNIDLDFTPARFQINSQPYNPGAMPRTLFLGKAYEWILTSRLANHPFHIHVNPFEVVQWNDAEGNSRLPVIDGARKTIWKDTILTPQNPANAGAQKIRVRSRSEVYIGRFVIHCHILDHEDQGMMQDVEIVPPGSAH